MKVVVREAAARDLEAIFAWIVEHNAGAAAAMVERIRGRIERLAFPGLARVGRPGLIEGTRELVEPPYIIVYEVHEAVDEIDVLAVVHGARDRKDQR